MSAGSVESSWNVMAHSDARGLKWKGNWRNEWVASTLHTTSEHGVSSITTADAHTSAASSRLNWRPRRFKWTRPFGRSTKSGLCACAITFQTRSTSPVPFPPYVNSAWKHFPPTFLHNRHSFALITSVSTLARPSHSDESTLPRNVRTFTTRCQNLAQLIRTV
jgi:hypothetical protein